MVAGVTPRTEAGRAMADWLADFDDEAEVLVRILAIEQKAAVLDVELLTQTLVRDGCIDGMHHAIHIESALERHGVRVRGHCCCCKDHCRDHSESLDE